MRTSVAEDLGGRFRQALATEQSLQSRVEALKAQLLGEQRRSIQFNILQRDVDTNRALYDALLQRFKEVGIAGGDVGDECFLAGLAKAGEGGVDAI